MNAAFTPQLLVVDDIWRDPENEDVLNAQISVGGHPHRVILDFATVSSGLVRYVQIPWMLGVHEPSQKAVVRLMTRFHNGEPLAFPADLSDALAAADPPSPFRVDRQRTRDSSVNLIHQCGPYKYPAFRYLPGTLPGCGAGRG